MKDKKYHKKNVNSEVQQLQKLHEDFESQVKKRLTKLKVSSEKSLGNKELRESEELFRTTFNHAAIGIAHVDLQTGRWIRVNKRFCEIAGWSEEELLQHTFLQTTHPDDHKEDLRLIDDVLSGKVEAINMEKRYVRKDGTNRWVYATASVIRDQNKKPKYGIAIVEDIHEQKKSDQMLRLLADSSRILAESLNYKEAVSQVVDLLIPEVADWCTVDLLGEDDVYHRVKVGYARHEDSEIAAKLYKYTADTKSKNLFIDKALLSRKSILIKKIDPKKTFNFVTDEEHLKLILSINQKSFMAVPLIARGKIIGVITLRSTQDSRLYSKVDLLFAEQIANRIALAVDNSRLFYKAQKAVSIRDDFLAIASHELKTSLTTIKALTQIMQRESDRNGNDRSLNLFTKMDTQLNRTTKLINDLLDVGKIHTGKYTMTKEELDIDAVVRESVENCQRFSPIHKIVLKGKTKEKVYADKDRLHQVLANLITNAIKYSFDSVDIVVTLRKDKNNIIIGVQDFGIGIEKNETQKIFERFFRADTKARDRTSGLGLGLYISHELVKQHNGFIQVKSKVGEGSTFYIYLPRLSEDTKKVNKALAQNGINS
jgi:PAS domain S-box-containing protein